LKSDRELYPRRRNRVRSAATRIRAIFPKKLKNDRAHSLHDKTGIETPTMSDDDTTANPESNNKLAARAAKLSTRGAHFFVGWLISSGKHIPEVAEVFERALHHLETDPKLQYCWRESAQPEEAPTSVVPIAPATVQEQPAVPAIPFRVLEDQDHGQPAGGLVQTESAPASSSASPGGFLARLFRKERVAA